MSRLASLLLVLLLPAAAQVTPAGSEEEALQEKLRDVRLDIVESIQTRDIDRLMYFIHPDITVTWQNSEVCHGREELKAFYERMGKDAFTGFKVPHEPDRASILHGGDTAIAAGRIVADYHLLGRDLEFESRWTATLVLEDDRWLVAAYHVSLDALDNPILDTVKSLVWIAAAAAFIAGLVLALLICKLRRPKPAKPAPALV